MTSIPLCWAAPILPGETEYVYKWFADLNDRHKDDMYDHMKRSRMTRYHAWVQSGLEGDWLIEYTESGHTQPEIQAYCKAQPYPFLTYCNDMRERVNGDWLNDMKGFRQVVNESFTDITDQCHPTSIALPIQTGKLNELVAQLDSWLRELDDQLVEYASIMGICRWQAWIQQYQDQHVLIHLFYITGDIKHFMEQFKDLSHPLSQKIITIGEQALNINITNPEQPLKLTELSHFNYPQK